MSEPSLGDLPTRAQIGYVLTHGRVTHGELTPRRVVGILDAKGVLADDRDDAVTVAEDVFAHRGLEYAGGGR